MDKKKDSLVISLDKYNMISVLIPIAYGIQWLYSKEPLIKLISPCLHLYNLGRSIYDRFNFHSKAENTSQFINKEFTKGEATYSFTGIDYSYGLSITEFVSVTGLISDLLGFLSTQNTFISFVNSLLNKISDNIKISCDILKKASDYSTVAMFTLTGMNFLLGSSTASIKINYDVFTPARDSDEIYSDPFEVYNFEE